MLAVRVEKALPLLDKKAPVIALAMAAAVVGTSSPCASRLSPLGAARTVTVPGALSMRKMARTLPGRSTTAITARCPRA